MTKLNADPSYDLVIGLEIHAQLATESKIFCADNTPFGAEPNTNISAITLGHPGTLPVLNKKVVEYAIKMGLACHSTITNEISFDRKNYFYPDLPKGYQITQDNTPICVGGYVTISIDHDSKDIKLNRIHLEEDAGKSIHLSGESDTAVDFNRAGVPLIEIVTDPVIHSAKEARAMLNEVRKIVRYLEICDGNMEEGSLRCDVNISIKEQGSDELGKKVEVKNLNSARNVERAILYETERQINLAKKGVEIISETRTFDDQTGITSTLRTKETLNDYRYFPDPDLSPVHITKDWLETIKSEMPKTPHEMAVHLKKEYKLSTYDAQLLAEDKYQALYYESVCNLITNFKAAANWILGPVKNIINERSLKKKEFPLNAKALADIIELIDADKISFSIASQKLFPAMVKDTSLSAEEFAIKMNLIQQNDLNALEILVDQVLQEFPKKVMAYKKGKKGLLGMFVGEIMKRSGGRVNPKKLNELLIEKLS